MGVAADAVEEEGNKKKEAQILAKETMAQRRVSFWVGFGGGEEEVLASCLK